MKHVQSYSILSYHIISYHIPPSFVAKILNLNIGGIGIKMQGENSETIGSCEKNSKKKEKKKRNSSKDLDQRKKMRKRSC